MKREMKEFAISYYQLNMMKKQQFIETKPKTCLKRDGIVFLKKNKFNIFIFIRQTVPMRLPVVSVNQEAQGKAQEANLEEGQLGPLGKTPMRLPVAFVSNINQEGTQEGIQEEVLEEALVQVLVQVLEQVLVQVLG